MLKYFAIQRPKQKSKVMHTMVIIITITPNCVIILHYTTYMLYFILMYSCIPYSCIKIYTCICYIQGPNFFCIHSK